MADGKPGRPKIYDNGEYNSYPYEWRRNFKKEWEEATALLRRIKYEKKNKMKSDSLYI